MEREETTGVMSERLSILNLQQKTEGLVVRAQHHKYYYLLPNEEEKEAIAICIVNVSNPSIQMANNDRHNSKMTESLHMLV